MNKTFVGLIIGLLVGAGGMWLGLRHAGGGEAPKAEAAAPAEKPKENPLHVPPARRTALGITLVKPTEATLAPEVTAFGRVLDATPLVTLVAELATARAASAASDKELERAKKLFAAGGNASAQAVETAQANAARDRAALASAQARLLASWGRDIAKNLDAIAKALEDGAAIARLDLLPGEPSATAPKTARISLPGGGEAFDAEILGSAPVADPQVQGASFLVLFRDHPLPAGAALRATLAGTGETAKALVVPRTAVVYHEGSAWVYVLGEEDTFERKIVTLGRGVGADGVAVVSGLEDSEQVVVTGAQQLLAAELQAGSPPAEG